MPLEASPNLAGNAGGTQPTGTGELQAGTPKEKIVRPDVPQRIQGAVKQWWIDTDNLVQRANALWEFREANKVLFPARFNPNDPRRGQTPFELRSGRDDRRVQTPYIFRDSLQSTAMTVPDDTTFTWTPVEQVKAPTPPAAAMVPTMAMAAGAPPPPMTAMLPPVSANPDPQTETFGQTLKIVQARLLNEVLWLRKVQAWVQDATCFPCSVIKYGFWRDYRTSYLTETPPTKDQSDSVARLEGLITQHANGDFNSDSDKYQEILQLAASLQNNAEVMRWFGIDITLVPMDAFGVSEDAADLVSIYDASWMFNDILMTGQELLAKHPFKELEDGTTEGLLPDELEQATPWDQRSASTDPNSRNRISRNKQLTTPRATPANAATASSMSVDPKKLKFMVREVWCKRDRTVYVIVRGIDHFIRRYIPQKTSQRWYPFAILAPNRVPGEVYGASDLELKKDIVKRILRKRSDEETARWLHLRRYVYNKGDVDEKEIAKVQDIPPGQFKGITLPPGTKLEDAVLPVEQPFTPESFDTQLDERDKDMMSALPVQALGTTGQAKFSSEVQVAAQGATIALQFRQAQVRREIEGFLQALAEILLQELTPDEVRDLAGPFAFWPELYDEREAAQIKLQARDRARKTVLPMVLTQLLQEAQAQAQVSGTPPAQPDPREIMLRADMLAAPVWQAELQQTYGAAEPATRESIFRRLSVKVKSTLTSTLDRQQRIQSLSLLAQSTMQLAQAAQMSALPFDPRAFLEIGAKLVGEEENLDRIFPAVDPVQRAAQQVVQAASTPPGGEDKGKDGPPQQPPAAGGAGGPPGRPGGQSPQNQGQAPQHGPDKVAAATSPR